MAAKKQQSREQLTIHYLDRALRDNTTVSTEKIIDSVEKIVDCIMRARRCDQTNEFYVAIETELDCDTQPPTLPA